MPELVGKEIGPVGYGLMGLTWRPDPPSREQSFKAMRAALAAGSNFWNGGELYGTPARNSLHLLAEYFEKYPEDASKVVLSIKGGLKPGEMAPDGSEENVQRSIDECLKHLKDVKKLDLFECARVDPNTPYETSVGQIKKNVEKGNVGGVSLSEVGEQSIRRAAKVAKVEAVEVEFSLFCTDILHNGIAKACGELDIPIVAYSPLCRGLLSGAMSSADAVPDRLKAMFPRFQGEALDANLKLVQRIQELAKAKGCTMPQIALSWVTHMSKRNGLPTIIPIPGATTPERIDENTKVVDLSEDDMKAFDQFIESAEVAGQRYGHGAQLMNG